MPQHSLRKGLPYSAVGYFVQGAGAGSANGTYNPDGLGVTGEPKYRNNSWELSRVPGADTWFLSCDGKWAYSVKGAGNEPPSKGWQPLLGWPQPAPSVFPGPRPLGLPGRANHEAWSAQVIAAAKTPAFDSDTLAAELLEACLRPVTLDVQLALWPQELTAAECQRWALSCAKMTVEQELKEMRQAVNWEHQQMELDRAVDDEVSAGIADKM